MVERQAERSAQPTATPRPSPRPVVSLRDLTKQNIETIAQLEAAAKTGQPVYKIADVVTSVCGSMPYAVFHVIWFAAWIGANLLLPRAQRFDQFPFSLLTMVVSLEAIFLSIFILMSEKRQKVADERRARLDLQVNLLSEQENTRTLQLLVKVAEKLQVDIGEELHGFLEETRPEEILGDIKDSHEGAGASG
jgi:uncharacterized membrane protein